MPGIDAINTVLSRTDRPAWVRFETVAVENKKETLKQGKWVGEDVDYVHITPAYSKDEVDKKASVWLEQLDLQVIQGKIPQAWRDRYVAEYQAFKKGQELPVNGTPIKGWGVISPAQQKVLISCRILTVEDLAAINDDGMRAVGMGSVDMKQKAVAWLSQMGDKGPLTIKMAAVEAENRELTIKVDTLTTQVQELLRQSRTAAYTLPQETLPVVMPTITANDLLPEDETPRVASANAPTLPLPSEPPLVVKKRRGNPNWVKKALPAEG